MFVTKYSLGFPSSNIVGAALLFSFLVATMIIIGCGKSTTLTHAYAEKKMTIPFFIPTFYINDNNIASHETGIITISSAINNNDSGNDSSHNIISTQQQVLHNVNTTNASSYQTYEDSADGISLMYPSSWQKIEYPSVAMNYGEGHRIIANFLAPLDPSDQWRASINIQISNSSNLKNIIPHRENATTINLAGHDAFRLEYTNTERIFLSRDLTNSNSIKLRVMQVWTTIGDNTYIFTYNAETSKYQQYLPVMERMLSSFRSSPNM
jgi:hypothetical protein